MITKNTIKISSIVLISIIGLSLLLFIFRNQIPIFLPNQEKEIKVRIADHNIEARIITYIDKQHRKNFEVHLYNNQTKEKLTPYIVGENKFTPVGKFHYIYIVQKSENYTAKIKNKTNSIIFSNIIIRDND